MCPQREALGIDSMPLQPEGLLREYLLSPPASTSAHLLRFSGILPALQQAWQKVSYCCLEGYRSVALVPHGNVCVWWV